MIKNFFSIILILLIFISNSIPAFSKTGSDTSILDVNYYQNVFENPESDKYFKDISKYYQKSWRKNKQLFRDKKYKTSFARVLFVVNKNGEILSHDIKSSCIPHGDTMFLEKIKQTINVTKQITPFPLNYQYDNITFTIKFHAKLPGNINKNGIDWEHYGVADIEIDNHSSQIIKKDY